MLFINRNKPSKYRVYKDYYKFRLRFLWNRLWDKYPKRYVYGNQVLPDTHERHSDGVTYKH